MIHNCSKFIQSILTCRSHSCVQKGGIAFKCLFLLSKLNMGQLGLQVDSHGPQRWVHEKSPSLHQYLIDDRHWVRERVFEWLVKNYLNLEPETKCQNQYLNMPMNLMEDIKFVSHTSLVFLEGGFFEENLVNPFLLLALLRVESFLGHLADSQLAISRTHC